MAIVAQSVSEKAQRPIVIGNVAGAMEDAPDAM